ncbi:MAG: cobalamin B12-binding domain-containing protein [Phycisphaerae bacterium]|jgi:methylmalonyl-CoA mutase C-terminal domain/subunit
MTEKKRVRILLAKPGLDGHDVGAKIVVRALMDAGFDVIYTGLRKTPEQIVRTAVDEDATVLGLSILSGSHLPICERIRALLDGMGLSDLLWIVGGNIPERDCHPLYALGVSAVFPAGTPTAKIVDYIRENAA